MTGRRIPHRGDVYWVDPNPVAGREIKDRHRFVVITPKEINALGVAVTVPVTSGGVFARNMGPCGECYRPGIGLLSPEDIFYFLPN